MGSTGKARGQLRPAVLGCQQECPARAVNPPP